MMRDDLEEKPNITDLPVSLVISDRGGRPFYKNVKFTGALKKFWLEYVELFLKNGHPQIRSGDSKETSIDNHHKELQKKLSDSHGHEIALKADLDENKKRSTQSDLGWKSSSAKWVGHYAVTKKGETEKVAFFGMENPATKNPNNVKQIYNSSN